MANNENTPSFEEVAAKVKARDPNFSEGPKPDQPTSRGPATPYGDELHVNPALVDTPLWTPQPERVVVPVVNDPGLLGAQPSLADLNRAARSDDVARGGDQKIGKGADIDDTGGMTEDSNRDEVRQAARARMDRLRNEERAGEKEARVAASDQKADGRRKAN